MTVNPLPPQAYTKETLQKAYTWLLTQNASVKEMATSQEFLVSMYLKAQRSGDASLETPSVQNFKQELKNLASMMGDLQPPLSSTSAQTQAHQQQPTPLSNMQMQSPSAQQARNAGSANAGSLTARAGMPQNFSSAPPSGYSLDEQSLMAIQEVKQALNLSTDSEALRALISLGHRQFKKM